MLVTKSSALFEQKTRVDQVLARNGALLGKDFDKNCKYRFDSAETLLQFFLDKSEVAIGMYEEQKCARN